MATIEIVRKAQRIVETAECEDARYHAARALVSVAHGEIEDAVEDLNYAASMAA